LRARLRREEQRAHHRVLSVELRRRAAGREARAVAVEVEPVVEVHVDGGDGERRRAPLGGAQRDQRARHHLALHRRELDRSGAAELGDDARARLGERAVHRLGKLGGRRRVRHLRDEVDVEAGHRAPVRRRDPQAEVGHRRVRRREREERVRRHPRREDVQVDELLEAVRV